MSKIRSAKNNTAAFPALDLADAVLAALVGIAESEGEGEAATAICAYLCARERLFKTLRLYLDAAVLAEKP